MQKRNEQGRRPRIGVSLDEEDYDWVDSLPGESASLSYKVSRVIKAARLAGLTIEDAKSVGVLEDFADFLKTKKRNKFAADLHALLEEYTRQK